MAAAQEKREKVAQFILHCEAQAEFAKAEAERIRARGKVFSNAAERVRAYVLGYILAQGADLKGKFQKLLGKTTSMSARSNPASVEILNEEEIPAKYKWVRVELPLEVWYQIVDQMPNETATATKSMDIDRRAIKEAIGRGEDVAGADLNIGKYSLSIR